MKNNSNLKHIKFYYYKNTNLSKLIKDLNEIINKNNYKYIGITGGGSCKYYKFIQDNIGVKLIKKDEFSSLVYGVRFLLSFPENIYIYKEKLINLNQQIPKKYIITNIGSGISIIKIIDKNYERIGGTNMGGTTFYKLCQAITKEMRFDKILKSSEKGDSNKVDMLVKDIYGTSYLNLDEDVVASSFGKYNFKNNKNDIIASLLKMFCYNISHIVSLYCKIHNISDVIFTGFFTNNNVQVIKKINYGLNYWSKGKINDYYLKYNGYVGAIGSMI